MTTNTALATREQGTEVAERNPARALMRKYEERITPFLPKGITFERVMGEVALACRENPAILKCSEDSIIRAVIRALRMDLEIGTEFYLVPFKGTCTGIAGYKGLATLAIRCGAARSVQAKCVYEGEEFHIEHGLQPVLRHVPTLAAKQRGRLLGAYYVIRLPRNEFLFDFLPLDDIEAVRAKSQQWGPGTVKDCPPWWAEKRAVLKGLGLVPKNARYADMLRAVAADEEAEFGEFAEHGGELASGAPALRLAAGDDDHRPRPIMDHGDDVYGPDDHGNERGEG